MLILFFLGYQGMGGSPAKHVTVVQQPQLQIQPPILSQPGQQQYVPVSVVEPTGRQMLLTVRALSLSLMEIGNISICRTPSKRHGLPVGSKWL